MRYTTKAAVISTAAAAAQTLPEPAVRVTKVVGLAGGATSIAATNYTLVSGAPGAGQVQFTGTPQSPSATLTFNAALPAAGLLVVEYVPVGAIGAAA